MKTKIFHLTMALILAVALMPALFLQATPVSASPGEVTVTLRPSADGTDTTFDTLVPADTDHYILVNEEAADWSTSYIQDEDDDEKDSFELTDSGLTAEDGCIIRLTVRAYAQRTTSSHHNMKFIVRTHDTYYEGPNEGLSRDWNLESHTWRTNPNTGDPWTWTEVDNLEAGVTTNVDDDPGGRVTQLWVEVTWCPFCDTLRPSDDGTDTTFDTLVPADTDHYILVNEEIADDDTYIEDNDDDRKDSFELTNTTLSGDICCAITVYAWAERIDYSNDNMKFIIRTHDTYYEGPNEGLGYSWALESHTWTTNPATGLPFTVSELNALEAGVTTNVDSDSGARVSQLWVEVCCDPKFTLDMEKGGTGSGSVTPVDGDYCPYVTITASPDCDDAFAGWTTGDMSEIENPTFKKTTLHLDQAKQVTGNFALEPMVHVAFILDGSGSITDAGAWDPMIEGLASTIENVDCAAKGGHVELTVVQFGGQEYDTYNARLEVGPVVITAANAATIAAQIRGIEQMGGYTPMACGIYLAADILAGDPSGHLSGTPWEGQESLCFEPEHIHVINIFTDGEPNRCCPDDTKYYTDERCDNEARVNAVAARDYLISLLQMSDDPDSGDRIFAEAINNIPWLRDAIVWPQPGAEATIPPPPLPTDVGWVYQLTNIGICTDLKSPTVTDSWANDWTEPGKAVSSNDEYATTSTGGHNQGYGGFGFSISADATITGIEVQAEAKSCDSSGCDLRARLCSDNGAGDWTGYEKVDLTNAEPTHKLGGETELWGRTWVPADFLNANFVVEVNFDKKSGCKGCTALASLDHLQVKVCYSDLDDELEGIFCAKFKMFEPPTGKLEVVKELDPTDDPGKFDLQINSETKKSDAIHDDSTGEVTVNTGTNTVGETAGTNTDLNDYGTCIECKDSNGAGSVVASSSDAGPLDVTVNKDDDIVCTITNTRDTGKLEVVKKLDPTDDLGLFNLQIDSATEKSDASHDDSTGEITVNTGTHTVGETAGTDTDLNDYGTCIECKDANGAGSVVASSSDAGPLDVTVNKDDDIVCTITNTAQKGSITVEKVTDPSPDLMDTSFSFALGGDASGNTSLKDGGSHTFTDLLPGTYTVTETVPGAWTLTGATCDATAYTNGDNIVLDAGETVTCTFTNTFLEPGNGPEPPPPPPAVGGEAYPVNKIAILAPWIAIAMAIIAGSFIVVRRRRSVRLLRR